MKKLTNEELINLLKKIVELYDAGLISIESVIDIDSAIVNLLINNK